MNIVIAALVGGMLMFPIAGVSVYAADEPVKSEGAAGAKEPGREGDPASAEKKQTGTKESVTTNPEESAKEPGREGDPESAEKKQTGTREGVTTNPEERAKEPGRN